MAKQNIYDDLAFFQGYRRIREECGGLNEVLEQPALRSCLPSLPGLAVLDVGCGMGHLALRCAEEGAARVVACDISEKMLEVARRERAHPRITYVRRAAEDLDFQHGSFDLVVSSLALHYVADYPRLVRRVADWLRPEGRFVYSVEHPIATASKPMGGWAEDYDGNRLYWPVDDYSEEGRRKQTWFVEGVVKYHRKSSTLLNALTTAGFVVERVEEPEPLPEAVRERPTLDDERRRPPFLIVRSAKPPGAPVGPRPGT